MTSKEKDFSIEEDSKENSLKNSNDNSSHDSSPDNSQQKGNSKEDKNKQEETEVEQKSNLENQEEIDQQETEQKEKNSDENFNENSSQEEEKSSQQELEEYKDNLRRLQAEFENYRKRVTKEKSDIYRYNGFEIFEDLLPILDNYYRAVEIESDDEKVKSFLEGFKYINKQFEDLFQKHNVIPLASKGEELNPEKHQAIQSEEKEGKEERDEVAEVLQQGYAMNERTLRVASVKVTKIRTKKKGDKNE